MTTTTAHCWSSHSSDRLHTKNAMSLWLWAAAKWRAVSSPMFVALMRTPRLTSISTMLYLPIIDAQCSRLNLCSSLHHNSISIHQYCQSTMYCLGLQYSSLVQYINDYLQITLKHQLHVGTLMFWHSAVSACMHDTSVVTVNQIETETETAVFYYLRGSSSPQRFRPKTARCFASFYFFVAYTRSTILYPLHDGVIKSSAINLHLTFYLQLCPSPQVSIQCCVWPLLMTVGET